MMIDVNPNVPQNLLLDSNIRDWVVLPLLVIMIAAGLLRHHVSVWLRTTSKPIPYHDVQARNLLQRATRLHSISNVSKVKWEARRRYYSTGLLREEVARLEQERKQQEEQAKNDSTRMEDFNPMSAMMDTVKGNAVFMVQNMVMMQGISFFFQGYVLLKVPFSLTNGFSKSFLLRVHKSMHDFPFFKFLSILNTILTQFIFFYFFSMRSVIEMMFQRGLDLSTLDTSYVSSVSWYFLVMFGLRAFFRLAIGELNQETQESTITQHSFGITNVAPNPQNKFNPEQALKTEADNLQFQKQIESLDDVEKRLLGHRYPKRRKI